MERKHFGILKSAALAAAMVLAAATGAMAQGKDMLTFVLGGPVLTLDPGIAAGTQAQTVRLQIMEPLLSRDSETSEIKPLLATSWSVADDKVTWTFKLRQGVTFHDGTPFTAAAVRSEEHTSELQSQFHL